MLVLRRLRSVVGDCARVISFGAKIREPARKQFISTQKGICSRCEDTYSKLLKHLSPINSGTRVDRHRYVAVRQKGIRNTKVFGITRERPDGNSS